PRQPRQGTWSRRALPADAPRAPATAPRPVHGTGKSGARRSAGRPSGRCSLWPPSFRLGGARRVKGEPGDDLVSDDAGQVFERSLLGGNGGIFRAYDVDPGVEPGSVVEHHLTIRQVDQLVAGAERAPLLRRHLVRADAVGGN